MRWFYKRYCIFKFLSVPRWQDRTHRSLNPCMTVCLYLTLQGKRKKGIKEEKENHHSLPISVRLVFSSFQNAPRSRWGMPSTPLQCTTNTTVKHGAAQHIPPRGPSIRYSAAWHQLFPLPRPAAQPPAPAPCSSVTTHHGFSACEHQHRRARAYL
jgi:hypothetical protein